ncbi:MAG TPA: hypothetical protein VGG73_21415, partial [Vicinamibacterales bacterium]
MSLAIGVIAAGFAAQAQELSPGNLLVSRSVYKGSKKTVSLGEVLPPGCTGTTGGCAGTSGAIADGSY